MFKPNQYPKVQAVYIFILALAWSLYAYKKGIVMSLDSDRYSRWADVLLKYDFNIFKYLENVDMYIPPIFYFNWVAIVAFNKLLLGENWEVGVVVVNLVVGISIAVLLFKTTWATSGKPVCVIFAGLFLLFCFDFFNWMHYMLSDTIFSSLCFLIFILITRLYQQPADLLKRVAGIVILLCYALFFRPSWPPLLLFTILSIPLIFFFRPKTSNSTQRHEFIIRCALLACILIPTIIFCHSYFMLHPDKWPFSFFGNVVSWIAHDYQQGAVIWEHFETYHSPPENILDYALISIHKLFAFFYITVNSYSSIHSLINYIFFLPVYGLSIWAVIQLFKKENGPSPSNWWNIFSCALFIFLFAFFHSLEQIEYDFRYRVPCLLPLILLAALGLNELINGFSKRA
jgi:hypothetical protein